MPFSICMLHSNPKQSPARQKISTEGFLQDDSFNTGTLDLLVGYSVLLESMVNT